MKITLGGGTAAQIEVASLACVLKDIGIVFELKFLSFSGALERDGLKEFARLYRYDGFFCCGIHELLGERYGRSLRSVRVCSAGAKGERRAGK